MPVLGAQLAVAGIEEAHLDAAGQELRGGGRDAGVGAHAGCVRDLESRRSQAVERGDGVGREDRRAAAAERARHGGARAQQAIVGRSRGSVPSLRASTKPAAAVARSSAATASSLHGRAGGPAGSTSSSAPTRAASRSSRVTLASIAASLTRPVAYGSDQRVAPRAVRAGHGEVERRVAGGLGAARRRPVRHHEPVPAPLVVQDLLEHRRLGHRRAVDGVVGGHHGPRARVSDDRLEGRQVQLAQRPLGDARLEREALGLGVVGHEVLDRRGDALGLEAAHVGGADPAGQQRVLAEGLEVAAAVRRAVEVDHRRQHDVDPLAARLGGQQAAEPLDPRLVPGCRQQRRRRHVGRRLALVPALAAHAGRPVGRHEPSQPDRGLVVQRPEVGAREQAHLLLQAQPPQPLRQKTLAHGRILAVCRRRWSPPCSPSPASWPWPASRGPSTSSAAPRIATGRRR